MGHNTTDTLTPLTITVLTVSDTRNEDSDTSGAYLVDALLSGGHILQEKCIVRDDVYAIRARLSQWIADANTQVVLITGGTGFTSRDSTPEAVIPLFDKVVEGFGEVFRALSLEEIGLSTVQSRAVAGLANDTLIFCVPGSTGACRTAWTKIIAPQIDSRQGPCNFVPHLKNSDTLLCKQRG